MRSNVEIELDFGRAGCGEMPHFVFLSRTVCDHRVMSRFLFWITMKWEENVFENIKLIVGRQKLIEVCGLLKVVVLVEQLCERTMI